MVRVSDVAESLRFDREAAGREVLREAEVSRGRFTPCFLAAPGQPGAQVDLTRHRDERGRTGGRNFGDLA